MSALIDKSGRVAYFGQVTWANCVDWLVTLCLGAILISASVHLGGVRPDSQLQTLPLFAVLLGLHGLWMLLNKESPRRLHPAPLLFLPFLAWAILSGLFWTAAPWRGSFELVHIISAFLFGWVAVNNVRTRAHLWGLILLTLIPLWKGLSIGLYQFFQNPEHMAEPATKYPVELSDQFAGRSTGLFADPGSFALYLMALLPCFMVAAFVRRLPFILRTLCFYMSLIMVTSLTLTQTYWAAAVTIVLMVGVPIFCFKKRFKRILFSVLSIGVAVAVFFSIFFYTPSFKASLTQALSTDNEVERVTLWKEALKGVTERPLRGAGAGSYALDFEHSAELSMAKLPFTPHNDFMLLLGQYGALGALLLLLPFAWLLLRGLRQWAAEPYQVRVHGTKKWTMPLQKFFLSIALCGTFAFTMGAFFSSILNVPALILHLVLLGAILAKSSLRRTALLPKFPFLGFLLFLVSATVGLLFWQLGTITVESAALELEARERLEQLATKRAAISGNMDDVEDVIALYEDALEADSANTDAWIGLSMAICQLHYHNPSAFEQTGARALFAARRAYEISPHYWLASAQLGVAHSLAGESEEAATALKRAVEMAPNSSNAHYYYAAFLGDHSTLREKAIWHVRRALEINPDNAAARRLKQKLLIL